MNKTDKIYVAGHRGMVGSAVCRCLARHGFDNVVTRTHAELDLMNPAAVKAFYESERPDVAVIAAAKVGGIGANSAANADFLYQNILIAMNTVQAAAERRRDYTNWNCSAARRGTRPHRPRPR